MVRRVLTFLSFVGVAEFFRGRGGGLKLEINIPSQRISAKRKGGGGLINEGGVISSEYGTTFPHLLVNNSFIHILGVLPLCA